MLTPWQAPLSVKENVDTRDHGIKGGIGLPNTFRKEPWQDFDIAKDIPVEYQRIGPKMIESFSDIMSNVPGKTHVAEQKITHTDKTSVMVRQFRLHFHYEDKVSEELKKLLKMGIVEHSDSPFSSPILAAIKKKR